MSTLPYPSSRVNTTPPAQPPAPAPARPGRSICLIDHPTAQAAGLVRITVGGEQDTYALAVIPCSWGPAYRLTHVDDTARSYRVVFQKDGVSTCECKGHLRHGHCKHVDGLAELRRVGQLRDVRPAPVVTLREAAEGALEFLARAYSGDPEAGVVIEELREALRSGR
jgi:hypothetical protein